MRLIIISILCFVGGMLGSKFVDDALTAKAADDTIVLPSTKVDNSVNAMIGFEMDGKGRVMKFMDFQLTDGANGMLHGYTPRTGDVVEWYVRQADCAQPEKSCSFELGIRRRP